MNKLTLAITLAATAAAAIVPANAAPRNNSTNTNAFATTTGSTLKVGDRCFKPTDSGRGYGYWTSCDQVYAFVLGHPHLTINREVQVQIESGGGTEGGGGGEGSSGGGGNR